MFLTKIYQRLIYGQIDPDSLPPDQARQIRYIHSVLLLMILVGAPFVVRSIHWELPLRLFCLATGITIALALLLGNRQRRNLAAVGNLTVLGLAIAVLGGILTGGGFFGPGMGWLWILPVLAGFMVGIKSAVVWALVSLCFVLTFFWLASRGLVIPDQTPPDSQLSHRLLQYLGIYGSGILMTLGFLASLRFSERRFKTVIAQLEREVASREQAEQEALRASQAKSQFLANVSHELRTPMNAIIGMVQLMQASDAASPHQRQMQVIEHSGRFLLNLINDVLDFSKIEANRLELEDAPFLFDEMINNLAITMGFSAQEKQLTLHVEIDPDVPPALAGDELRLAQVLTNLLSNAVKFTETGHVELGVQMVEQREEEIWLDIWVRDTGIGMSEEYAGTLFSPFSQADTSITRRYGGTGLGLAISKRLVDMMGGEIKVSSVLGQGSQFHLRVPLHPGDTTAEIAPYLALYHSVTDVCRGKRALILAGAPQQGGSQRDIQSLARLLSALNMNVLVLDQLENIPPQIDLIAVSEAHISLLAALDKQRAETPPRLIFASSFTSPTPTTATGPSYILQMPFTRASIVTALARLFHVGPVQQLQSKTNQAVLLGRTLLLVEDNVVNQEVAKRILEKAGALVRVANDGREAVELVQAESFDAVLMDVQMPVMDGIEATRQIRALPNIQQVPIIGMTAHVHQSYIDACIDAGMSACLSKPYRRETLITALEHWLRAPAQ